MMHRWVSCALVILAALLARAARAETGAQTLVLPFRSVGVNDTTIMVSRDLLLGELQGMGLPLVSANSNGALLPSGPEACDNALCASTLGRDNGATQVVYGSLSKLGSKVIVRLNVTRVDETMPFYRDQLTAISVEDLDAVMRRFAEGIVQGRTNSDRASVESVTEAETITPPRRAMRTSFGLRAGFLFPTGNSFGGTDRLTNIHGVYRNEFKNFQVETTTLFGLSWGDGNLDWTLLDLSASRLFGTQDVTTFLGAAFGVHSVTVARDQTYSYDGPYPYSYVSRVRQTETVPTLDLTAGLIALRTYDFQAILEVRFHYVFASFDEVGGDGANGVQVTFGTSSNPGAMRKGGR